MSLTTRQGPMAGRVLLGAVVAPLHHSDEPGIVVGPNTLPFLHSWYFRSDADLL